MKKAMLMALISLTMLGQSCKDDQSQETSKKEQAMSTQKLDAIFPKGDLGPKEFFTGHAWNYNLLSIDSTNNTLVGNVYFEPGARSNWHTHPAGQILIITDGVGYHQIEGQAVETIKKGDVVWCPPNVKHWHGASEDVGLQQLYIVPNTEKGIVNWMEQVSDEQYKS